MELSHRKKLEMLLYIYIIGHLFIGIAWVTFGRGHIKSPAPRVTFGGHVKSSAPRTTLGLHCTNVAHDHVSAAVHVHSDRHLLFKVDIQYNIAQNCPIYIHEYKKVLLLSFRGGLECERVSVQRWSSPRWSGTTVGGWLHSHCSCCWTEVWSLPTNVTQSTRPANLKFLHA